MIKEEYINTLEGIKAENLNLDDGYTKNRYEALEMAIKALEQEPCDDAVSKQGAIEAFQIFREYESNRSNKEWVDRIETVLNQLPPVTPQPKTGHWIDTGSGQECSECHEIQYGYDSFRFYCAKCGSKNMEVSE